MTVQSGNTLMVKVVTKRKVRLEFCLEVGVFERIELI